eukprot:7086142-Lingulodinium_polyedra.AAC.1
MAMQQTVFHPWPAIPWPAIPMAVLPRPCLQTQFTQWPSIRRFLPWLFIDGQPPMASQWPINSQPTG